jgi:Ferredoxin-like domain in Api92-like protein
MPNWCENYLQVDGDKLEVLSFVNAVSAPISGEPEDGEEYRICRSLLPLPENAHKILDNGIRAFTDIGYNTALAMWGTKWGDCDTTMLESSTPVSANFYYQTAWSPMTEALLSISAMFPKLKFRQAYIEEGNAFCGGEVVENGLVMVRTDVTLDDAPLYDENDENKYYEDHQNWRNEKLEAVQNVVGI